jgi:diacylglycerol kinase
MKRIKEKINYFADSFNYASRGIQYAWKTEQNFRTEIVIAILVIAMMLIFPLRPIQQVLLGLLIVWVLTLELINTVLERMADIMKPKAHPYVKVTKDLMAGAVLISAAGAAVIGVIIFYPYWANFIGYLLNVYGG